MKKSVTPDYIVCLEDGKKFKSLKRHLRTQYNMTPEQYREKWGLPVDYPMVAPTTPRPAPSSPRKWASASSAGSAAPRAAAAKRRQRDQESAAPRGRFFAFSGPESFPLTSNRLAFELPHFLAAKRIRVAEQCSSSGSGRVSLPGKTGCDRLRGSCRAAPGNGGAGSPRSRSRWHRQCSR